MDNHKQYRAPVSGVVTLGQVQSAIQKGDYQELKNLLTGFNLGKFPPHRQDTHVWTFLNEAVTRRYPLIAKLLLTKFKKANFPTNVGNPLIFTAIQQGDVEMMAVLAEFGADLNMNHNGTTPLFQALKSGFMSGVEFFLRKGVDPNSRGAWNGETPLHFAVKQGNLELLYFLLENGANLNTQEKFKHTPLHLAVKGGNVEMVKYMIEKGADVNIRGEYGQTPLHVAVKSDNFEKVKFWSGRSRDFNNSDRFGQNSLHIADKKERLKLVKLLLDQGANLEAETTSGKRPLHLAASSEDQEICNYLLEKGACVNAADREQETPLFVAAKANNEDIVKLLLTKGADINVQTSSNENLLHCASNMSWEIFKYFVQKGVNVNLNNDEERTPLFYAAKDNKLENVQFLLKHGARLNGEDKNHGELYELVYKSKPKILKLILECHPNLYFRRRRAHSYFSFMESNYSDDSECGCSDEEGSKEERWQIQDLKNIVLLVERGLDADMEITYQSTNATLLFHAMSESHSLVVRVLEAGADVDLESRYYYNMQPDDDYYDKRHMYDNFNEDRKVYSPLYAVILGDEAKKDLSLVTTLLQYGADFNDLPDDFDRGFSRGYSSLNSSLREFIRHIALMVDQDWEVNERILDRIPTVFPEFYKECKKEIKKLKTEKFGETSSSFIEVLTMDARQLAEFMRNKGVIDELEAAEYEDQFPIYGSAITLQLEMGLRRRKLLDKAAQNCFTVFPCLPRSVSEEIFSYLDNKDVRVLLLACQASRSRPWPPKQS